MYKNNSIDAKTLKEEYALTSMDSWTVDRVMLFCQYQDNLVLPYDNILDRYEDYFEPYLIEVEIDPKYFKRPQMFSEYYYGDPSLYWLILYFSKIPSVLNFTKRKIKILPLDKMKDLNQIFINYKNLIETNKDNPVKF